MEGPLSAPHLACAYRSMNCKSARRSGGKRKPYVASAFSIGIGETRLRDGVVTETLSDGF